MMNEPDQSDTPPALSDGGRAVERAAGDLRRGVPVVVVDGRGGTLVLASEHASPATLEPLRAWTGTALELVITAHRARVLHMAPAEGEVVPLVVEAEGDAAIADLADPTADLANPLRGPFRIAARPVTARDRAAVALCKAARLLPAALTAALPAAGGEPRAWAEARGLLSVSAAQIAGHSDATALPLTRVASARVPLAGAEDTRIVAFRPGDGGLEHLAILIGDPPRDRPVLTRLHSECFTGDLLESLRCDCGQQLRGAIELMAKEGAGVLLYLAQEGRGIGLVNKLRAYALQDQGFDTIEANFRLGFEADERLFAPAAEMLRQLGFGRVRLLTNNPQKVAGLERCGIEVSERVPHAFPATGHNDAYLETKARRSGHWL